jgi:hypothetical protein
MDLRDPPALVNQIRDTAGVFVFRRSGGAVSDPDLMVGVAQQRKLKSEFLGEFSVVLDLIEAGAEDLNVFLGVLVGEVPEPGPFRRSAGCVGFREEPQQHFLAAKVAQLHPAAKMIGGFEIRRRVANFQHR